MPPFCCSRRLFPSFGPCLHGCCSPVSLLAFLVYARDKHAAKRGGWRTPESTLLMLALLGGWPGSIVAQQLLRHKSHKPSFRLKFWLTVSLNHALFLFAATPLLNRLSP